VDESAININKWDYNQSNQNAYLEYLVHVSCLPRLPVNLRPITEKEMYEINNSLKWRNSCGYDNIPCRIVKLSMPLISSPLIYICNKMLSTGTFPSRLKFSQIVLVF
jgi:hypothetical protein